ncbi:Uncharacterized protein APZ42_017982 [Daphnia magna]|uniref:Uncharacterized protein n=1 Tax=Daphnia magna TaxID=35525 RepID=A0A0P5AZE8_9CRUS|nr:Uncharacterized protein APZ42_017982 [Daphnia magna]
MHRIPPIITWFLKQSSEALRICLVANTHNIVVVETVFIHVFLPWNESQKKNKKSI